MSSSLATAQHLQKVHLELEGSDVSFLRSFLSSLSYSQSLQELSVLCNALGVLSGCAAQACMHSHIRTHTTQHMPEHTTSITCPQGQYACRQF